MPKQFILKKDVYREKRGHYSRFLNVFCESCGGHLVLYQKDGPGELRRLYLDRICAPSISRSSTGEFVCPKCEKVIGTFYIYQKEKRPAIRLYQGSVVKRVDTGVYPSSRR